VILFQNDVNELYNSSARSEFPATQIGARS